MPKGGGEAWGQERKGREGRETGCRGFLAGHERLSGSQWTKLSNNKVEATVCSYPSSSSPFLIHSQSDSCASPALSLSLSPVEPARACSSRAVPFPLFIILAFGNVLPTLQPARSPRLCFNFVWCITLPPIGQPSPSPTAHSSSADTCKCRVYSLANISLKFYSAFAGHTHFYADLCNSVCKQ